MKIKTASGPIKLFMRMRGFIGYASLWGTVYLMPGFENDQRLIRHEAEHMAQMKRDGKLLYMLKTVMWLVLVGYYDSPYEVQARAASDRLDSQANA